MCEGGLQCDPHREPPSERNCNLGPCPTKPSTTSPPTEVKGEKVLTTIKDTVTKTVESDVVNADQYLPEPTTTSTAYYQTTDTVKHADDIEDRTAPGEDSVFENQDTMGNTESEVSEKNKDSSQLNPVEGGMDMDDSNKVQQTTNVKPTTSKDVEHTISKIVVVETDENNTPDRESVNESDDKPNKSEIEQVHQKHRHHHGEYMGAVEETDVIERNPDDANIVIDAKFDSGLKGIKAEHSELDVAKTEKSNTTFNSSDMDNSSHAGVPENTTVSLGAMKADIADENSETNKSNEDSTSHAETLPIMNLNDPLKLNEMPPFPNVNNLPPLRTGNIPPLPDISELSPFPSISGIPALPDKNTGLSTLPDVENLPPIMDKNENTHTKLPGKDLPPLPDKDKLASLPKHDKDLPALPDKHNLAPLPNLDNIPSLSDKDLPALPDKENLAPLPNPDDIPSLSDKDLPALPDKKKLAPLPDYGDLPPFADLPKMPNLDKLASLPKTETSVENIRSDSEETNADVFILKSNTDIHTNESGDASVKLGGSDTNMILGEGNEGISSVNISDSGGSYRLQAQTTERNYTWIASNWTEVRNLSRVTRKPVFEVSNQV